MRRAPLLLAFFFIAITVYRVSTYTSISLRQDWLGYCFGVGTALGVYVSAYAATKPKARWWGIGGLVVFGLADLLFNELELVINMSSGDIVQSNSNFIGMDAVTLKHLVQFSAIAFGFLPTVFAGILGGMQAAIEKVPELNKQGALSRLFSALFGIFGNMATAMAIRVEIMAGVRQIAGGDNNPPNMLPGVPMKVTRRGWHTLSADEVATIPGMSREMMMTIFGISNGAAGDWKRKVLSGERPWKQFENKQ